MADFKTHSAFGAALGVLGAIGLACTALNDGSGFSVAVFGAALLGSILPDMDSDSGVPFHTVFGSLSLVFGVLTFIELSKSGVYEPYSIAIRAFGASFIVWGVVGTVFKRFTRHRGMAHSIPAAILSGMVTDVLALKFSFTQQESFLLGVVIMAGYLLHLILDELYAAVHFDGTPFKPKHSLGSAMKIVSHSIPMNIVIYACIFFMLAGNFSRYYEITRALLKRIS